MSTIDNNSHVCILRWNLLKIVFCENKTSWGLRVPFDWLIYQEILLFNVYMYSIYILLLHIIQRKLALLIAEVHIKNPYKHLIRKTYY